MKKTVIFLADGFEEIEALTAVDLLRRANIECSMVSITGKLMVTGSHGIQVMADEIFIKENYLNKDAIILPGGPGTAKLKEHDGVTSLIKCFDKNKKMIGAICAAPSILGELGILVDKAATCYPSVTDKLIGAIIQYNAVVVDDYILTSQGVGTAIEFACKIIEILENKEISDNIKKSIIYEC